MLLDLGFGIISFLLFISALIIMLMCIGLLVNLILFCIDEDMAEDVNRRLGQYLRLKLRFKGDRNNDKA